MPDKVYVISRLGHPLMPCSPAKARHLLDDKKAKVVKRMPFTIRLLYGSTKYIQPIILGVDAGSKTIGLSASTAKEEVFAAEVMPRNDVVENLSTRREFRRARRNRTTRYRKPRSGNRVRSNHERWLAPSVKVKIQDAYYFYQEGMYYPAYQQGSHRDCRIRPSTSQSYSGGKAYPGRRGLSEGRNVRFL